MIYGMNGITFPIGTVGAARQTEAIINSIKPGGAAMTGYIPYGKGDTDSIALGMTIDGKNYDAVAVENGIGDGSPTSVTHYLQSIGATLGISSTPGAVTIRPMSLVDQATAGTLTPIVTQQGPTMVSTAPSMMDSIIGSSSLLSSPFIWMIAGVGIILLMSKD